MPFVADADKFLDDKHQQRIIINKGNEKAREKFSLTDMYLGEMERR